MAKNTESATLLKKYGTARETRASALLAHKSDTPASVDYTQAGNKRNKNKKTIVAKQDVIDDVVSSESDDNEDHGSGDDETSDSDDDADEPEGFAPSDSMKRKRGHQTGLSISLSNTSISKYSNNKKRARSPTGDENEDEQRPAKVVKSTHQEEHDEVEEDTSGDDSDYNGVDLISQSGEEDEELEREEEDMIIAEESTDDMNLGQHVRSDSTESWEGFAVEDTIVTDDPDFVAAQIDGTNYGDDMLYMTGALSDTPNRSRSTRRVRFAETVQVDDRDSSSSDVSDSDVDNDAFPDIFMAQDQLDPSFRQEIENGNDDGISPVDSNESYWDLDGNDENQGIYFGTGEGEPSSQVVDQGYDTDEGETTDEEILPIMTISRPEALLQLHAQSPRPRSKSAPSTNIRGRPVASSPASAKGKGPSMGSFSADPSKPWAVFTSKKSMIIVPPKSSQTTTARNSAESSAATSPLVACNPFDDSDSDYSGQNFDTMMFPSAGVMMSGLFAQTDGNSNGQLIGPEEAFFPADQDENAIYEEDIDTDEEGIDLLDLIQFPGEDSDDENSDSDNAVGDTSTFSATMGTTNGQSPSNGPRSPNSSFLESRSEILLKHFDRGPVVSSFRRNQTRHQSYLRRPFVGSPGLYGIRGGHHGLANNPISPLRKRKGSSGNGRNQLFDKFATKKIGVAARIRKRTLTL